MDNVEQDKIRERNQIMDDLKNILLIRNGLRVETIVKDNHELLDLLEKLKAMDGVRDAVWSEIVGTVGNKMSVPSYIIDRL